MADPRLVENASSNRVVSQSASSILRGIRAENGKWSALGSGTQALDELLRGGFEKGKVTEIWGPSGAGKTAIALSTASAVLKKDGHLNWIACASPLSSLRLQSVGDETVLARLHYKTCPDLSHLIADLQRPSTTLTTEENQLLVIDDLNTLFDLDYPRQHAFASSTDSESKKWQAGRRAAVLAWTISILNSIATQHNIAVIIINGTATTTRDRGLGSAVVSGIGGGQWDVGVWTRLIVFNDFNGRFVAVQKLRGVTSSTPSTVHVLLSPTGLLQDAVDEKPCASTITSMPDPATKKRVFEEIADSEDDEQYHWDLSDGEF